MARVFTSPIVLPADPSSSNHASNKNYVDNGLSGKVDTSDSRLSDSRAPSGTAGGALNGSYPNPALDAVPFPTSTITYASTINADPTVSNNFNITATGNITSLAVSSTGAVDGQMVTIAVLASSGARTITPATGTVGAQVIPSGAVGFFGFRYSSLLASPVFVCIAYQPSA